MKIVQLKNFTPTQMTGFLIKTDGGHIIAVDGGNRGDTEGFLSCLEKLAGSRQSRIDLWLMTHPHDDHYGVFQTLTDMARRGEPVPEVGTFAYSALPDEFGEAEKIFAGQIVEFNAAVKATPYPVHDLSLHETFTFDNLTVKTLRIANPSIRANAFNNASVVFRLTERRDGRPDFVWIILGDLGIEGGFELLGMYPEGIAGDAVQMAHHGQNGVSKEVYQAISPRFAFWSTPDWLWTNTIPGQPDGSGPWQTLKVRAWMDEMGTYAVRPTDTSLLLDTADETVSAF